MRVNGTGPAPASLLLLAESPSLDERSLDRALAAHHLPPRADCFLTYACREWLITSSGQTREPTIDELVRDWPDLELELEIVNPKLIITLGRTAARALLGDHLLDAIHGVLQARGDFVIFPCWFPATTIHNPLIDKLVAEDFDLLATFLHLCGIHPASQPQV